MRLQLQWALWVLSCGPGLASEASAATFTTVDYGQPGAVITQATGVNNAATMVGTYQTLGFGVFTERAFIRRATDTAGTVLAAPGWDITRPKAINNQGQVIGAVFSKTTPATSNFVYQAGTWTFFNTPAAGSPEAINDAGTIVGSYLRGSFPISSCFVRLGTTIQTIDPVGSDSCLAHAVNLGGAVAGEVLTATGWHGFYRAPTGRVTLLDYPGAIETHAFGLSKTGVVVGSYLDRAHVWHGFKWAALSYASIDVPGSVYTVATLINKSGVIAGQALVGGQQVHFALVGGTYRTLPKVAGSYYPQVTAMNDALTIVGVYSSSVAGGNDGTFKTTCTGTGCH